MDPIIIFTYLKGGYEVCLGDFRPDSLLKIRELVSDHVPVERKAI